MPLEPVKLRWQWDTDDKCSAVLRGKHFLFKATARHESNTTPAWLWELNALWPPEPLFLGQDVYTGREDSIVTAQKAVAALVAACEREGRPRARPSAAPDPHRELMVPQPPPSDSEHPAVWPLVFKDMLARHAEGERKYGKPLRSHNGRDALTDAYQEALDLAVYLRQAIFERDGE